MITSEEPMLISRWGLITLLKPAHAHGWGEVTQQKNPLLVMHYYTKFCNS